MRQKRNETETSGRGTDVNEKKGGTPTHLTNQEINSSESHRKGRDKGP